MAITVFQRYEKKFLMDKETMQRLLPVIMAHMTADEYCKNGNTYPIANLYYDTAGDDVIRNSLEKPFYKEKLRMRSYGIPKSDRAEVFLEVKKKINGIVTKRRAKLTYEEAKTFLKKSVMPEKASYMTGQVLREISYYLSQNQVYPKVFISYDRMAFFDSTDSSFRLTFDQNLRYLRAPEGQKIDYSDAPSCRPLMPSDFVLMEVKVSTAYPKWFADLLCKEEVYQHSFSKIGVAYKSYLKEEVTDEPEKWDILGHI